MTPAIFEKRLAREKRARLEAERLLEMKAAELYTANLELAKYADDLTDEIESTQLEYFAARSMAENLESQTTLIRQDLDAANKAVFTAERRLWDGIEAIKDGFAWFDQNDRMISANSAYSSFLSFLGDIVRPGLDYGVMINGLVASGMVDMGPLTAQEWHDRAMAWHADQDGDPLEVHLQGDHWILATERRTDEGDMVSLVYNITTAKRRERELDEARAQAEAANRAKSAFLANMSHEIRTPMNGVVGMADLLCETRLDLEQMQFAETIKHSGEALLVIINDVLDYSKIEAGKLDLFPEPFNLERCVHDVVHLMQPKARDRNLDLLIDYDMFLPSEYVGDVGRLRQVLTNLVGNAVKFTTDGFVLVRVVGMETAPGQQEIHIAVEDSGIGISPYKISHIFGEFNQIDDQANRKFEGTGLGLAITQRLISLMGGEIWVESSLGQGSCFGFRITLPISATEEILTRPEHPAFSKALIVDDFPVNRVILERQLSLLGIAARICTSAAEAMALLSQPGHGIDVVLTDHQMPDRDGIWLAEAVNRTQSGLPVILLTSQNAQTRPLLDSGVLAGCLTKPILRKDLKQLLVDGTKRNGAPPKNLRSAGRDRTKSLRKLKLLAAEDNRTNQLVLRKMLADFEVDLTFASNGLEAIAAYKTGQFDIVFMDISMPDMDGIEATSLIRTFERETGRMATPIVALTAHAMTGDAKRFLAAGMDHYLTKPLKKAVIMAKLAEILKIDFASTRTTLTEPNPQLATTPKLSQTG